MKAYEATLHKCPGVILRPCRKFCYQNLQKSASFAPAGQGSVVLHREHAHLRQLRNKQDPPQRWQEIKISTKGRAEVW